MICFLMKHYKLAYMKIVNIILAFVCICATTDQRLSSTIKKIKAGDIIFQTSRSDQSLAIQLATKSKYSHVGIIYEIDGIFFVFEAVQPVKFTRLDDWIAR